MARKRSLTSQLYRAARASNNLRAVSRGPVALSKRQVRRSALPDERGPDASVPEGDRDEQVSDEPDEVAESLSERLARLEERVPREIDSLPEFAKLVQRMFTEVAERLERLQGEGMSARFEVDLDRLEELARLFL